MHLYTYNTLPRHFDDEAFAGLLVRLAQARVVLDAQALTTKSARLVVSLCVPRATPGRTPGALVARVHIGDGPGSYADVPPVHVKDALTMSLLCFPENSDARTRADWPGGRVEFMGSDPDTLARVDTIMVLAAALVEVFPSAGGAGGTTGCGSTAMARRTTTSARWPSPGSTSGAGLCHGWKTCYRGATKMTPKASRRCQVDLGHFDGVTYWVDDADFAAALVIIRQSAVMHEANAMGGNHPAKWTMLLRLKTNRTLRREQVAFGGYVSVETGPDINHRWNKPFGEEVSGVSMVFHTAVDKRQRYPASPMEISSCLAVMSRVLALKLAAAIFAEAMPGRLEPNGSHKFYLYDEANDPDRARVLVQELLPRVPIEARSGRMGVGDWTVALAMFLPDCYEEEGA
jgi:hypothetical protein